MMRIAKRKHRTNKKLVASVIVASLVVGVVAVAGCAGKQNLGYPTPEAEPVETTPETDEYGIVTAESWAEDYPYQYESYMQNLENQPADYESSDDTTTPDSDLKPEDPDLTGWEETSGNKLTIYPEILTIGKGYGYTKYYTEPGGHVYSLWTVTHNGRVGEKTTIGCWSCKTPQFSNLIDELTEGGTTNLEVFKTSFWDYAGSFSENISCASCHGDDPTTLEVDRYDWVRAMGDDADTYSLEGQVCGQCHCDYSMDPVTGAPTSPYYGGVDTMVPDLALQWYDENNYVDYTYETTGAKMIAVRHAEYEFNYGGEGNHMTNMGYDCNDCHMPATFAEDGTAYTSHYWQSPLENADLLERDCNTCHKDLASEVKAWQEEGTTLIHTAGLRLEQYIHNFENAITAGTIADDTTLERLRTIQRSAGYYWNLTSAENSNGAHNIQLVRECIAKTNELLDEGDELLGTSSVVEETPVSVEL